jgi:FkbM family methyltransferase
VKFPRYATAILGYTVSALLGLLLVYQGPRYFPEIFLKVIGRGSSCSWRSALSLSDYADRLVRATEEKKATAVRVGTDGSLPIDSWRLPQSRDFWIPRAGAMDGKALLCYLLADHALLDSEYRSHGVRSGDVVLDGGAHVGVFTDVALRRGASRVVAIEPDTLNRECLTRNFAAEIAAGKVVVVPQGIWSYRGRLSFHEGATNSGTAGVVFNDGGATSMIDVTTIDEIVRDLRLPRVDFIKLDIEGAEREALKGASDTMRHFRPRLMLDPYHRPDDPVVLPQIIHSAQPGYREACGPCEITPSRLVPHVLYLE